MSFDTHGPEQAIGLIRAVGTGEKVIRKSGSLGAMLAMVVAAVLAGCTGEENGSGDLPQEPDWTAMYQAEVTRSESELRQDGIEPPNDAEFIRFIEPGDYGRVHSDCIREQGFDATMTFDGGVHFGEIPEEQAPAQRQAIHRCLVMYPTHPRYTVPLSEEQIRVMYDYYVGPLTECLAGGGYQVEAAPSWETFLEHHGTPMAWIPYHAVDAQTPEEWEDINQLCPQNPPLEELYGTEG